MLLRLIGQGAKLSVPLLFSHHQAFSAATATVALQPSQFLLRNCLKMGLGFTDQAIDRLFAKQPDLFADKGPAEVAIPAIWATFQRYGITNLPKFRELCEREPRIAGLEISQIERLLKLMQEYRMLNNQDLLFDMWLRFPQTLLKRAEKTERLLIVMWKLIGCDKKYVGELILGLPVLMLCSAENTTRILREFNVRRIFSVRLLQQLMREPRVLLLKYSTMRGLIMILRMQLHVGTPNISKMLEREPGMILQHVDESLKKKIELLEEFGVNRGMQKELIERAPAFYLKKLSTLKDKLDILKLTLGAKLQHEASFPLILIKSYKHVIKPRCEVIRRRKKFLPLHEVFGCSDAEFCRIMQITPESLKKFVPEQADDDEFDSFPLVRETEYDGKKMVEPAEESVMSEEDEMTATTDINEAK